jgi:glycosyltransferase involved in cell wall biosynthesis
MERYIVALAQSLTARGHRSIVQFNQPPASRQVDIDLRAAGAEILIERLHDDVASSTLQLIRLQRRFHATIAHCHFVGYRALLAMSILRTLGVWRQAIATVHNVNGLHPGSRARFAYVGFDRVLAVSNAVCRDLINGRVSSSRVAVHTLGIAPTVGHVIDRPRMRAELGFGETDYVVGCIAFDAPFKGIPTLLHALAELAHIDGTRSADVCVLQVGVDPAQSNLPELTRALGVDRRVRWAGIRNDARELLQACDAFVQPSLFGEGLPLSIMEAMAAQLPIIVTDVAGNVEAITHLETGLVVPPDQPASMAKALSMLVESPELAEHLAVRARHRFLADFELGGSIERLLAEYRL